MTAMARSDTGNWQQFAAGMNAASDLPAGSGFTAAAATPPRPAPSAASTATARNPFASMPRELRNTQLRSNLAAVAEAFNAASSGSANTLPQVQQHAAAPACAWPCPSSGSSPLPSPGAVYGGAGAHSSPLPSPGAMYGVTGHHAAIGAPMLPGCSPPYAAVGMSLTQPSSLRAHQQSPQELQLQQHLQQLQMQQHLQQLHLQLTQAHSTQHAGACSTSPGMLLPSAAAAGGDSAPLAYMMHDPSNSLLQEQLSPPQGYASGGLLESELLLGGSAPMMGALHSDPLPCLAASLLRAEPQASQQQRHPGAAAQLADGWAAPHGHMPWAFAAAPRPPGLNVDTLRTSSSHQALPQLEVRMQQQIMTLLPDQ